MDRARPAAKRQSSSSSRLTPPHRFLHVERRNELARLVSAQAPLLLWLLSLLVLLLLAPTRTRVGRQRGRAAQDRRWRPAAFTRARARAGGRRRARRTSRLSRVGRAAESEGRHRRDRDRRWRGRRCVGVAVSRAVEMKSGRGARSGAWGAAEGGRRHGRDGLEDGGCRMVGVGRCV